MKKIIWLTGLLLFLAMGETKAQDYTTALGLRLGPYYGVTLKHFFQQNKALEAVLITRDRGFGLTGLYEFHTNAFRTPRLQAYGGIGGHVNIYRVDYSRVWNWDNERENGISVGEEHRMHIGLDMIIGIEYTFQGLPFVAGVDWKPAINILGDQGLSTDQVAVSLRFVLK